MFGPVDSTQNLKFEKFIFSVGQCENWDGSERPINLFFGVQNTVPLHAKNKRSDFGYLMQFVADLVTSIDTRGNKGIFWIFENFHPAL